MNYRFEIMKKYPRKRVGVLSLLSAKNLCTRRVHKFSADYLADNYTTLLRQKGAFCKSDEQIHALPIPLLHRENCSQNSFNFY